MFKKLSIVVLFFALIVVGFWYTNKNNSAKAISSTVVCKWINSGEIKCFTGSLLQDALNTISNAIVDSPLNPVKFAAQQLPFAGDAIRDLDNKIIEAAVGDVSDSVYFDPDISKREGHAVFCNRDDKDIPDLTCIHFAGDNPLFGFVAPASTTITGVPGDSINWVPVGDIRQANAEAPNEDCSLKRTTNCTQEHEGDARYTGEGYDATGFLANIEAAQAAQALEDACEADGGAPLPFITCPIFNAVVSGISSLIGGQGTTGARDGILIEFLTVSPLESGDSSNVMQSFVGAIVGVANFLYIIVFLLLIFSSSFSLGLDNYTIKKMLPKFIAAVILTQFSFVICQFVIDVFNLLGNLVPNIIFSLPFTLEGIPSGGGGGSVSTGLNIVLLASLGSGAAGFAATFGWILIIILAFIALIAVLVGFVYMVLRYLVIYILVILSPLAFLAWVLPGTEKFFFSWWKNFLRVNAVFPMITGMLAIAIVLSQVIVASNANAATKFVAMLIPIVALFMIPKTLKWTTQGMNALAAGALGFAAGKMGAGAKAVGKGAQTAGKKGYSYGKDKGIDFGKRKGVEFLGRRGFSNTAIEREKGRQLSDERKKGDLRYSNMDLDQASASLNRSMAALAKNPHDIKAQADVHAGLARLNQLGGAGRKKIGIAQNQFRAAGGAYSTWASALGDSGVFGDLDEKSPELTLDWSSQPAPAGAPPGTPPSPPAAFFSEDGIRNVNITNGNQSITTLTSTDVSKKGAPDLGSLGSTTVQSMADIDTGLEAVQYGQHINWQAAATMASTPQMHPKDATTIQHWQKVGQRGVQYWENVGNQAAAAGNQALFDQATQNQAHAQAIVDGFGG